MLDRLWNGWRAQYVQGDSHGQHSDESVFTEILKSNRPDEETFIVHRGDTCFVIMNAYPYSSGHVLVIPYREVPDLELLTPQESIEIWATVTKAVQVLKAEYKPQGMNVGINLGHAAGGSVAQHLHIHIVPKYKEGYAFGSVFEMNPQKTYLSEAEYDKVIEKIKSNL